MTGGVAFEDPIVEFKGFWALSTGAKVLLK